jgi:hypothetical protein
LSRYLGTQSHTTNNNICSSQISRQRAMHLGFDALTQLYRDTGSASDICWKWGAMCHGHKRLSSLPSFCAAKHCEKDGGGIVHCHYHKHYHYR